MQNIINSSIQIKKDIDQNLVVMKNVATWLEQSGREPSIYWQSKNMNKDFMLKQAEPNEFYSLVIDGTPAAAMILQDNERNQSWKPIDKAKPQKALYIHWLCVDRPFAGKGFPKVLIDFSAEEAKMRNIHLLRLDTDAENKNLRKIYDDLGFKLMGIEQEDTGSTAFYQKEV